ncbi:hypothetical protein niasHT_019468 [Heterodera trifolii]|uniref:Uncharacterized protein n=1 Tax=Heterodera trifolii TaxID=157864 RepID=A0ABD2KVV5_9BILA
MFRKKLIKMLLFIFLLLPILCKKPQLHFGIDPLHLDLEYCRLFFDPTLDHCARSELSAKLSAVFICATIETDLKYIELKMEILQKSRSDSFGLNKIRGAWKNYEEIMAKIEEKSGGERMGMVVVCQLWDFMDGIKNLVEFMSRDAETTKKEMDRTMEQLRKMTNNRSSQCNELATVESIFEATNGHVPRWVLAFRDFVSEMHFSRLNELLAVAEEAQQNDFSVWANFSESIHGENELSYELRRMNGRGEIHHIVALKTTMNRYLMDNQYIGLLELNNPLTMAFEIMSTSLLKTAYRGMAMFEGEMAEERAQGNKDCLILRLLCGKILDYFEQQLKEAKMDGKNEKGEKMAKIGKFWKLFTRIFDLFKKESEMADKKSILIKLSQLLRYLRGQFGEQKVSNKWQLIGERFEKGFTELYKENEEFRTHLKRNITQMIGLFREICEIAEENGEEFFSKQFWTLFETILNKATTNTPQNEIKSRLLIECPKKNIPVEKLKEIDIIRTGGDKLPLLMTSLYKELLMKSVGKDESRGDNSSQIHILAMLLSYKIQIAFMIDIGQQFEERTEKFEDELENYMKEFVERPEFGSEEEELCEMHKLAHSIAKNGILREESAKWDKFIEQFVGNATKTPTERKLLLASESGDFRWSESDCADESVQNKLVIALYKKPNSLNHFHFVALNTLLKSLKELRHFFCHGNGQIDIFLIKEHFWFRFGDQLLDALELSQPLIMHFDLPIFFHRLLLQLLHFKTGTEQAEMVEARIFAPILLQEMEFFAKNTNGDNEPKAVDKAIAKTVEKFKAFFYELLLQRQMTDDDAEKGQIIRKTFCVLSNREENVKLEMEWRREWMRERNLQMAVNCFAQPELNMVEMIKGIKGGRTRLWKLLYKSDQKEEQKEKEMANLWETLELSEIITDYWDDRQLISHYEEALLCNVNDLVRTEGKMKAEIFLFIRWISSQFSPTNSFPAKVMENVQIYWSLSVKMLDNFYDKLFDQQRLDEVDQNEQELVELITEIRGQVERIVAGHPPTKSETERSKEWRRRHFAALRRSKRAEQFERAKHWAEYGPWMRQLHGQTLIGLIGMDQQFAQKLKKGKR